MITRFPSTLRCLSLALLLLASGCSGDEPDAKAEAVPDADVLGVLGVGASPGAPPGEGEAAGAPTVPEKAAAPVAPDQTATGNTGLKVEISKPRFDSGRESSPPRVTESPGSSLDY